MQKHTTVAVAGATGFVGRALCDALVAEGYRVFGLSRRGRAEGPVPLRQCDLMGASSTEGALEGADLAVYLVHSMMPNDRLVQGSFEDLDLIAADNFARAAAAAGVRQIVYLGGLAPIDEGETSAHLQSRMEVEDALASTGVPVTTLRAGLIFGPGGSSARIVFNLVKRLPVMICPAWTNVDTQPIGQDEVVALLSFVLGREECFGEVYDIGGPDVVTYKAMMAMVGEVIRGKEPLMGSVPVLTPELSRLWVSLVTGAPKDLVKPLIGSLSHRMLARDRRLQTMADLPGRPIREVLEAAVEADAEAGTPAAFKGTRGRKRTAAVRTVRSIQRLPLPPGARARDVGAAYFPWFDRTFGPVLEARAVAGGWELGLRAPGAPALLRLEPNLDAADRVRYAVRGGLLSEGEGGALEFREVLGGRHVIAAVSGFVPRLPWWLYVATQAQAHAGVMHLFGRFLARASALDPVPEGGSVTPLKAAS